jgi:hypothetical protein
MTCHPVDERWKIAMVEVSVTASVQVAGGPVVPIATTLRPESYTFASVALDAGTAEHQVDLLPEAGKVVLLMMVAKNSGIRTGPVVVTATPANGNARGDPLNLDGPLLVTNVDVLAALVSGGPRTVILKNTGAVPATVDILTGLDLP